ncbi:MAG: PHP domain-containing protein [Spirochaetes bacterium]|nr:PHP domain-containing protein [Spirochaetota bacterium]
MKKIDLHTHTTASDGIFSPSKLIDFAARNGVVALAVTDHDTVDGIPEAVEHARSVGFRLYPGVEFSIDYDAGSFHLIGLNIDYTDAEIRKTVRELADHRNRRAYRIIDELKKHDIDIPIGEVLAEASGGAVGRPHIARVMVSRGYGANLRDIFANYLVKGKPGYVKKIRIGLEEAVNLIKRCGGIPVIAHPVSLECADMREFETLLKGFIAAGVEGIEVYAGMHSPEMAREYLSIAEKYRLLVTGGSDFHGDKDETIGNYQKDCPIPFEIYRKLEEYIRNK